MFSWENKQDEEDDYVVHVPSNAAFWTTSKWPIIYAREERVVDWSSVACHEVGLELRYGSRLDWPSKNLVEWGCEGRIRGPYKIVHRVGPPPPIREKMVRRTGRKSSTVGGRRTMRRHSDKVKAGWK